MAVKIRLARCGRKKRPFYHVVVSDSRAPRDSKFIEKIGLYDPLTFPETIDIKFDRALYWIDKGAIPTDTCRSLLRKKGVFYWIHLLKGVKKGAFDEGTAKAKFEEWLKEKAKKQEEKIRKRNKELSELEKKRIEAEKIINEKRQQKIQEKLRKEREKQEEEKTNDESTV